MGNNDFHDHVSTVFGAIIGKPWSKEDRTDHSGGGATVHNYSGPCDGIKVYHDHSAYTLDKNGNKNSFDVHGLEIRPWEDR